MYRTVARKMKREEVCCVCFYLLICVFFLPHRTNNEKAPAWALKNKKRIKKKKKTEVHSVGRQNRTIAARLAW